MSPSKLGDGPRPPGGPQRRGMLMPLAHPGSSAPRSSPLCLAEPSQPPTQGPRAALLLWGGRHEPRPLEDRAAWGACVPPMSPPYPPDQNELRRGKMVLEHSEASRNAVGTSEAPPPSKTHSRDPGRRLSPLLCRTPPSTALPGGQASPPGPAGVDHPSTAAPPPPPAGEPAGGRRGWGSIPTGGALPP